MEIFQTIICIDYTDSRVCRSPLVVRVICSGVMERQCVSTSQKSHQTIWLYSTKPESKGEEAHIEDDCCFVC